MPTSLQSAPVEPAPQKSTASARAASERRRREPDREDAERASALRSLGAAVEPRSVPTKSQTASRASSSAFVDALPVADASVCVLP